MSAQTAVSSASETGGWLQACCTYSVLLTAPADDYDFSGCPRPPPAATSPYANTVGDYQKGPLFDGTGYFTDQRRYTNQTALHALGQLQGSSLFFVFGHGGASFQRSYQTVWSGGLWHYFVQKTAGRDTLLSEGVPADRIAALDELAGRPLEVVLLAVFEGCRTAYSATTWGSPTDGAFAKGADCSSGFTTEIFSHYGAKEGAQWFCRHLSVEGKSGEECGSGRRERRNERSSPGRRHARRARAAGGDGFKDAPLNPARPSRWRGADERLREPGRACCAISCAGGGAVRGWC